MKAKQDVYSRLYELITQGTYKEAAERLTKEGYKTPKGKKWNRQHIATWAFNQRKSNMGHKLATKKQPVAVKHVSAWKKLALIKEIVMGMH